MSGSTGIAQSETGESTETMQTEADGSAEPTEARVGESSDGRERACLKERNTVLSAKLEQREATIERQHERIGALEADLTELRASSASTTHDQTAHDETSADEFDSSSGSIWDKTKRLVGGSHS